jgi:acyl-CoA dehydrogenase
MDFAFPPEQLELRDRTAAFMREQVFPLEERVYAEPERLWELIEPLRERARTEGLFAPHVAKQHGGLGLDMRGQALVFEEAGKSLIGPLALNCSAPDEGNMHLLAVVGTPAQQERYLQPLAAGRVRSCFAMTEPAPGAGSDPALLNTRAERRADGRWAINGRKWFISGARGATFAICMALTGEALHGRQGATMFLVDADNPGFKLLREIPCMDDTFPGGHCELLFDECLVDESAVLGALGEGFRYAQVRLAPARLTHCMRWLGIAQRAIDIAAERALDRHSFGRTLSDHQAVQWMVADSAIDLHASRLMVWHAAWLIDNGGQARQETSIAKTFVSEAVGRVIDRAVQLCGAQGVSDDLPLARFYREVRAFRIYDGPSEVHRMTIARHILRGLRG